MCVFCLCMVFVFCFVLLEQVVSRGNDQVAITSRFESRADAGEKLAAMATNTQMNQTQQNQNF